MNKKRVPKTKVPCSICGKVLTKPGMVGHMAWAHQKQYSAPMLPVEKPQMPVGEARRKAALLDALTPLEFEKRVISCFDGRELKDAQGVVVGRFKVKKGARKAILLDSEGKPTGTWLVAGKGEAEKALLQLKK